MVCVIRVETSISVLGIRSVRSSGFELKSLLLKVLFPCENLKQSEAAVPEWHLQVVVLENLSRLASNSSSVPGWLRTPKSVRLWQT